MLTLNLLRHHDADLAEAFPDKSYEEVLTDVQEAVDATVFEIFPNNENGTPVATISRGAVLVDPAALRLLFDAAEVGLEGADEEAAERHGTTLEAAHSLYLALKANLDLSADDSVTG